MNLREVKGANTLKQTLQIALLAVFAGASALAQPTSFQFSVPNKGNPQFPIYAVRLLVTVSNAAAPTFRITDPTGQMLTIAAPALGTSSVPQAFSANPAGSAGPDQVVVVAPPAGLVAGDPQLQRWEIYIDLASDYSFSPDCRTSTMAAAETWIIETTTPGQTISGVCVLSYELNAPLAFCSDVSLTPALPANGLAQVTNPGGLPNSAQTCADVRPPIDAIMVLDRSGSMVTLSGGVSRLSALKSAVTQFINVWEGLRTLEATPPTDRLGMVFFDTDAHWMNAFNGAGGLANIPAWAGFGPGLSNFGAIANPIRNNIELVNLGDWTSLGDGMEQANSQLAGGAAGTRKVILAMSDGEENENRRIRVDNPAAPTQIETYNDFGAPTVATITNPTQVYTVTVGPAVGVSAALMQNMAKAKGGFYINSETQGPLLGPFFLEMLQNFLHFNSYDTIRFTSSLPQPAPPPTNVKASPPPTYTQSFFLNSTATGVSISASMAGNIDLRMEVLAPGIPTPLTTAGIGSVRLQQTLPMGGGFNAVGEWRVTVTAPQAPRTAQLNWVVIADDVGVGTAYRITSSNFVPGQRIRLQARALELGKPVTGLGTRAGERAIVQLVRPGVSIGELLAQAGPIDVPAGPDIRSRAAAMFGQLLLRQPDIIRTVVETIQLRDNGNAGNGDDRANDGVYSAYYTPTEVGHYNMLFTLEGRSQRAGTIMRHQLQTVHIRAVPDPGNSTVTVTSANGVALVTLTPQTSQKRPFGAGYGGHFWFTTGGQSYKAVDAFNGTYTARIPFNGPAPGVIAAHFLDTGYQIREDVNAPPIRLDPGSAFIPDVTKKGRRCFKTGSATILPLPIALLVIGAVLHWPRRRRI